MNPNLNNFFNVILGPIMLPHLISFLLRSFGTEGCVLIIGAMCTHIILAGLLLKPYMAEELESHRDSIGNDSLYKPPPSLIGFVIKFNFKFKSN